ncbi:MAG: hypothetical protein ACK559_40060, partial [bacterium]
PQRLDVRFFDQLNIKPICENELIANLLPQVYLQSLQTPNNLRQQTATLSVPLILVLTKVVATM